MTPIRYGGDEFVVILPGTPVQEACKLLQRLQYHFRDKPMRYDERVIAVSISCGVASMTDRKVADPESLLREADTMLYNIKKNKKTASA